jgi:hypothetical protein
LRAGFDDVRMDLDGTGGQRCPYESAEERK